MNCRKCGKILNSGEVFCSSCGAKSEHQTNTIVGILGKKRKKGKLGLTVSKSSMRIIAIIITCMILLSSCNINKDVDGTTDNPNENVVEETINKQEDVKRIGSEELGYVTIPDSWIKFVDLGGFNGLQFTDTAYIVTLHVYDDIIDAYSGANNLAYGMQLEGAENVEGAMVIVGEYLAYQVYGYYADENIWLVCWLFDTEDGKTHYIAVEGPDLSSEHFKIPYTFSFTE